MRIEGPGEQPPQYVCGGGRLRTGREGALEPVVMMHRELSQPLVQPEERHAVRRKDPAVIGKVMVLRQRAQEVAERIGVWLRCPDPDHG